MQYETSDVRNLVRALSAVLYVEAADIDIAASVPPELVELYETIMENPED